MEEHKIEHPILVQTSEGIHVYKHLAGLVFMAKVYKKPVVRKSPSIFNPVPKPNSKNPPFLQMKKVKKNLFGFYDNAIGKDFSALGRYGKHEIKNVVAFTTSEAKKLTKSPFISSKYPVRTKSEWNLIDKDPWGDKDKDNVPNWFDCKPKNKSEQGFLTKVTKKSLKRYKPQIERIAKKMEKRLGPLQSELTQVGEKIQSEKMREGQKRAEREAKKLLKQGVPISQIAGGIPIDLSTIPTDPALQKELEKKASRFQSEYLGYHSALNILREKPNPLRKLIIEKDGTEKRVVGFIYEDPHVLARRKGLLPEVKKEAQKIQEQYMAAKMITAAEDFEKMFPGMPERPPELKKKIQVPKSLELAPYSAPLETGVVVGGDVSGKIGELAATRVLKRKLSPEELKSQIELDTVYVIPEARGKGYGKKVIESLMKRPGLKKITASGEKEIFEKAWKPTGAVSRGEFDASGAIDLSKARGLMDVSEEEEMAAKLKEGHVDFEWVKKEPSKFQEFLSDKGAMVGRPKKKKEKEFTPREKNIINQMSPDWGERLKKLSPKEREDALNRAERIIEGPVKDAKGNWRIGDITLEVKKDEENLKKSKNYVPGQPDWLTKAFDDRDKGINRIIPMNEAARIQEVRRKGELPPSKAKNIFEALEENREISKKQKKELSKESKKAIKKFTKSILDDMDREMYMRSKKKHEEEEEAKGLMKFQAEYPDIFKETSAPQPRKISLKDAITLSEEALEGQPESMALKTIRAGVERLKRVEERLPEEHKQLSEEETERLFEGVAEAKRERRKEPLAEEVLEDIEREKEEKKFIKGVRKEFLREIKPLLAEEDQEKMMQEETYESLREEAEESTSELPDIEKQMKETADRIEKESSKGDEAP